MNAKPELLNRASYSVAEFSKLTGISIDILNRHIDGLTDTPLNVFYPSAKKMIDAAEGKRWLTSLPSERPQ